MNIVIIEPYDYHPRYDIRSLTPGLGPVSIASLLEKKGHYVQVVSEYVSRINFGDLEDADLIGISITTYNAERGFQIARKVQKPVVFGGFHASLMPEECLKYGDYVIRGDGYPIIDLVGFLEGQVPEKIQEISNLVYKLNGKICYNSTQAKAINVVLNFRLVKDYYRLNLNRLLRIPLLVNASRGCACRCEFCAIREVNKGVVKKDINIVIKDITTQIENQHMLSRYLPRVVWITDDNFFFDKKWAKKTLRKIAELETDYKFTIQARLDIARDDALLRLMKKAGVERVYLGIESLNPKTLSQYKKGTNPEEINFAVKKIKDSGIDVYGLFVFGDDEFRKGDGIKTVFFAKKLGLSGILIQPLTPYPGTTLFHKLKKEGRVLHENWRNYDGKVVFQPRHVSPSGLHQEICDAYTQFYSPLHLAKIFLKSKKGFKLGGITEAIFRNIESFKMKRFIKDHRAGWYV